MTQEMMGRELALECPHCGGVKLSRQPSHFGAGSALYKCWECGSIMGAKALLRHQEDERRDDGREQ